MPDIIDDFLHRLAQHAPELDSAVRVQLESTLRQEWGGSKSYVAKRFSVATKTAMLAGNLRQKKTLKECFADSGISRRTGYRLLAKKSG